MKQKDVDFWQKQIDASTRFMAPKHKLWKRLLQQYRLEFKDLQLPEDKQRKISRFYPITRQIISSVAFFHPRIMIRVEDNDRQFQSEIIERVANSSLRLQNAIQEVRQQIFDALYCGIGWIKMGVNPAGDEDKIPPYIANDSLTNGMMFAQRRSPFDVYPDPLTPPHDFGQARFVFEEMLAPFEFVMEDERFKNSNQRNKIKPLTKEETEEHVLENIQENPGLDEEEAEAARDSRIEGQYVLLREVHDRIHKRMITFAAGVEQPIEEVDHPFLAGQTMFEPDPFTGEERMVGFTPTEGYLVDSGFPYIPMKFDLSFDSFYGLPMMAYGEATQKAIIESLSRRMDNLKRGARLVVGNQKEKSLNPNIEEEFSAADDGQIIWTNDPNNSFREVLTGNILPDQLGAESDMRSYEEQTLNVASTSLGGSQRRITATQASLTASFGELNREWMQNEVARVFEKITYNNLRIMADRRYTPQNFLVNVSRGENDPVFEAVTSDMLMARFRVEIETGSMKPLFDQLERDDALALFNYIIQVPEVPRQEALKLLLRAFRVPNIEKFLGDEAHTDSVRAAQLENMLMLQGQPLQVTPLENHTVHMRYHQQVFETPHFTELLPQQQQAVQALVTQHMQLHQQALQQRAQGLRSGPSNVQDAGGGGGPASTVQQATGGVESAVRSAAQTIGQKVNVDANQN